MRSAIIGKNVRGWSILLGAAAAAFLAGREFHAMRLPDPVYPGPGVTRTDRLGAWHAPIAGGPGDTEVYFLEGSKTGGAALVLGGTHADEPAGYLAAVALVENCRVLAGRLIVVPRANASGFTHNLPQEAHPQRISLPVEGGLRHFTYGARATNPVDQWPDPQVYHLPGASQSLAGIETRNLNRSYPGRPDGTLTEQIAYAVTRLIAAEKADLALDLHEASPEYPVVNTIVAHERAMDLAALASLNLQSAGIVIGLEASPAGLRGLSHREWGDATPALALLMETANPAQGRLRGRTSAELAVAGRDRLYVAASARHRLAVPFSDQGWPLHLRVARHLAGVRELVRSLGELQPEKAIALDGLPDYKTLAAQGLGAVLRGNPKKG